VSAGLTDAQMRALRALDDLERARALTHPRDVARALWPDSPGWEQRARRGSTAAGGALGATMPMKAATVLWRLHARGCAQETSGRWRVTALGRAVLAGTGEPLPAPVRARSEPVVRKRKPPRN